MKNLILSALAWISFAPALSHAEITLDQAIASICAYDREIRSKGLYQNCFDNDVMCITKDPYAFSVDKRIKANLSIFGGNGNSCHWLVNKTTGAILSYQRSSSGE